MIETHCLKILASSSVRNLKRNSGFFIFMTKNNAQLIVGYEIPNTKMCIWCSGAKKKPATRAYRSRTKQDKVYFFCDKHSRYYERSKPQKENKKQQEQKQQPKKPEPKKSASPKTKKPEKKAKERIAEYGAVTSCAGCSRGGGVIHEHEGSMYCWRCYNEL